MTKKRKKKKKERALPLNNLETSFCQKMAIIEFILFPFLPWLPGVSKLNLFLRRSHHLLHPRVLAHFLYMVLIFLTLKIL